MRLWYRGVGEHSRNIPPPPGNFSISYSFLDNYIQTLRARVFERGVLYHLSISHSFIDILLIYQYVTHFSITIYISWLKGFRERDLAGGWTVGVSRGCEGRVSSLQSRGKSNTSVHQRPNRQVSIKDPTVKCLSKSNT